LRDVHDNNPGIKPEMVDAVLKLDGLRGLILETFGAGNAPSGQDGYVSPDTLTLYRGAKPLGITHIA
jgi:hypothetical protein